MSRVECSTGWQDLRSEGKKKRERKMGRKGGHWVWKRVEARQKKARRGKEKIKEEGRVYMEEDAGERANLETMERGNRGILEKE